MPFARAIALPPDCPVATTVRSAAAAIDGLGCAVGNAVSGALGGLAGGTLGARVGAAVSAILRPTPPRVRRPLHAASSNPSESLESRSDEDLLVLHRLGVQGMSPSPPAGPATWLRRVHLDLTGLPPTLEQLDAFLSGQVTDAEVVDGPDQPSRYVWTGPGPAGARKAAPRRRQPTRADNEAETEQRRGVRDRT